MATRLESALETRCVSKAVALGYYVRKFKAPGRRNVPDRLFLSPKGVCFFVEFKREGEEPRPGQTHEHNLIRKNGGVVYVCDSLKSFAIILENHS